MQLTSAEKQLYEQTSRQLLINCRAAWDGDVRDRDTVALCISSWFLVIESVVRLFSTSASTLGAVQARAGRWVQYAHHAKLIDLLDKCKQIDSIFTSIIISSEVSSLTAQCVRKTGLPGTHRIAAEIVLLRSENLPKVLSAVRTIWCYPTRLTLHRNDESAVEEWLAHDRELPSPSQELLPDIAARFHRCCPSSIRIDNTRLQLTSGAVADVPRAMGSQAAKAGASCTLAREHWKTLVACGFRWPSAERLGEPSSRLTFVAKNYATSRTIVMEPTAQACLQRLINDELIRVTWQATRGNGCPTDASRNRMLVGTPGFSTIDLSKASDSVHKDWVDVLLRGPLNRLLKAVRTPRVLLPDGRTVNMNKYAGMGGGCTFCLEVLVFSAIVEQVYQNRGYSQAVPYAVHGDDIIVVDEAYDECVNLLNEFGFEVNSEKSFTQPFLFRESCGYDYLFLDDGPAYCTPVRFSRHMNSLYHDLPQSVVNCWLSAERASREERRALRGLITLANAAWYSELSALESVLKRIFSRNGAHYYCEMPPEPDWYSYRENWLFSPTGEIGALPFGLHPDGLPAEKRVRRKVPDDVRYGWALLQSYAYNEHQFIEEPRLRWLRDECR